MNKIYRSCLVIACLSFPFYSCDTSKEDEDVLPAQDEVVYTVINANTTDRPVKPGVSADVNGAFFYRENYYFTPAPHRFTTDKNSFWAHFSGQDRKGPVVSLHGSKINGNAMCMNGTTGCDDLVPSTIWNLFGAQVQDRKLRWEYLSHDKRKGYRVEMTNVPTSATLKSAPSRISLDENINFQFERNAAADSIEIALLFVPKDKINNTLPFPFLEGLRSWGFAVEPHKSSLTMRREVLQSLGQRSGFPTANDSVFINLITARHVIKVIDNKEILITYTINNIRPVVLERKAN